MGLVHLYCGDGKGKTTAALGLSLRAAGAGKWVLFAQFYKDGSSSEIDLLRQLPGITVLVCPKRHGFFKRMNGAQREEARRDFTGLLEAALAEAADAELLVLDEVVSACNHGSVSEDTLLAFLRELPEGLEVVLTGRNPSPALLERADYVTEMKKIKHPFDHGIPARRGIEY